jgi:hypothetical protein
MVPSKHQPNGSEICWEVLSRGVFKVGVYRVTALLKNALY